MQLEIGMSPVNCVEWNRQRAGEDRERSRAGAPREPGSFRRRQLPPREARLPVAKEDG